MEVVLEALKNYGAAGVYLAMLGVVWRHGLEQNKKCTEQFQEMVNDYMGLLRENLKLLYRIDQRLEEDEETRKG